MALGVCPRAIAGRDARGGARLAAQAGTRRIRGGPHRRPAPGPRTAAARGLSAAALAEREAAARLHAPRGAVSVPSAFPGPPPRQQVELDGFPTVYAMCAIDALGIPAMAGRDSRIAAIDPRDGTPVVVSVRGGQWRWTPATAVVVFGSTRGYGTDCESSEVRCPNTTFHASRDSARAYLAARGDIDGQILDQEAAVERGRRNFGTLMQAAPRPGAPTATGPE